MIQRLVELLWRHNARIMVLLLACALMSVFGASRLRLDGDLARLLPQHAPSANGLARLETDYGSQIGQLTIILSGGDADQRRAFADALVPSLASIPEIARVEHVDPRSELTPWRLLYMDRADLDTIAERIERRIRWERKRANPLFADLSDEPPSVDLSDVEARYKDRQPTRTYYEDGQGAQGRLLLFLHPTFPASDLGRTSRLVTRVQSIVSDHLAKNAPDLSCAYTGRYQKRVEQQQLLIADTSRATALALSLICAFLLLYFLRLRPVLIVLAPLILGTLATMSIARLIFGDLNILTGFLGAVLMGLGVDYGIHLATRFYAHRAKGLDPKEAMCATLATTGRANLWAGLTTMIALGSLAVSDFRAFREFGVIALIGMATIQLAYLIALPTLVFALDPTPPARGTLASVLAHRAARLSPIRPITALAALVTICGLALASLSPSMRLNESFDLLVARNTPSWPLDEQVNTILGRSQTPAVVLVQDDAHAQRVVQTLKERQAKDPNGFALASTLTLSDAIPAEQDAKRATIARLIEQIDRIPEQRRSSELKSLDAELRAIHTSPPLSAATLPKNLTAPLSRRDPAQGSVVLVFPAVNLNQPSGMRAFTEVTRGLPDPAGQPTLDAIGESHLLYDILAYVTRDVRLMSIITLSGLVLVAFLAFGPSFDALFCLLAIGLGLTSATGLLVARGEQLNFISALILPIWLGLGVDASFHMLGALREGPRDRTAHIATAVSVSGAFITSMIGFGAMSLAGHPGLASLGRAALYGLALILTLQLSIVALVAAWRARRDT
jgi:predicted RND superfamily exporter protein